MIKKIFNDRQKIQDQIKSALEMKAHQTKALPVSSLNNILLPTLNQKIVVPKNIRPNKVDMIEASRSKNTYEMALNFAGNDGNCYVVFGGVGDLVLVLGECWEDPEAKVLFFANVNSRQFGEEFLKLFNKKYMVFPNLMGTSTAPRLVSDIRSTGRLMPSAHLADELDFDDWKRDTYKYKKRITSETDWKNFIGMESKAKKVMILCPSGSTKDLNRQRYLAHDEYLAIVHTYIRKGFMVYSTGSDMDCSYYPFIANPNHVWLMSDKIVDYKKNKISHAFEKFLKIINSADEVVSMDTWLKTYSCMAGIETKVIMNRSKNGYIDLFRDPSDCIFLNSDIWKHLETTTFDAVIS